MLRAVVVSVRLGASPHLDPRLTFKNRQVAEFTAETDALAARLRAAGPGAPGTPLPAGLELLAAFQQEAGALARRRDALRLAQMLFDLDVTPYPALAEVGAPVSHQNIRL
jgi:hypothetical protein